VPKDMITIGIDSSTTNCGIAVFVNGNLKETKNFEFPGRYSLDKLEDITNTFSNLFDEVKPNMVIMESPAPVRNSKTLTALNQVAGAIWAVAVVKGVFIASMHNKIVKKIMGTKTKEDAINLVKKKYKRKVKTDHEADAVLTVEAYRIHMENLSNGS